MSVKNLPESVIMSLIHSAPFPVPDWFVPRMSEKEPEPPSTNIMHFASSLRAVADHEHSADYLQRHFDDWRTSSFPLPPDCAEALTDPVKAWETYLARRENFHSARKRAIIAQWPWAYAKLVVLAGIDQGFLNPTKEG